MKTILTFIVLFTSALSQGQANLRKVPVSSLPEDIQNVPDISVALRWTDTLGDNVLVITKKIIKRDDEDRVVYHGRRGIINYPKDSRNKGGGSSKQTIPSKAYHFIIIKDSAVQTWAIVSISKICKEEDGTHTKNWYIVTDLDENATAEVWIISKAECINDPNGGTMEIVMCQDAYRYVMNGSILNNPSLENNLDNNFRNGPDVFRKYVLRLWQQFVLT